MQDNRQFFIALCTTFVHNYSEYCFQYNWIDIFRLENWLDFYCFAAYDPLRSSYSICLYQRIQWIKRQNFWRISTSIIRIYYEHQDCDTINNGRWLLWRNGHFLHQRIRVWIQSSAKSKYLSCFVRIIISKTLYYIQKCISFKLLSN